MKDSIKVVFRPKKLLAGGFLAITAFAICIVAYNNFKAGALFAAAFLLSSVTNIQSKSRPRGMWLLYGAWLFVTAFITLALSQLCLNESFPESGVLATVLGIFLIMAIFLLVFTITLRIRLSIVITASILLIFSCFNHFVYQFRGSEIVPADILSIATAGNVASNYNIRIPASMAYALIIIMIYYCFSAALPAL